MQYKDGSEVKHGDVIRWDCFDSDDFHTWTLTGVYTKKGVVYLGGGIDFGLGIGQIISEEEIINNLEDLDSHCQGLQNLGSASDLAIYIGKI